MRFFIYNKNYNNMTNYESGLAISSKLEKILNNKAQYCLDLGSLFEGKVVDGAFLSKLHFQHAELSNGNIIKYGNADLYNYITYKMLFHYLESITLNPSDATPKMFMIEKNSDTNYNVLVNGYSISVKISMEDGLTFRCYNEDFHPSSSTLQMIEDTLLKYFSTESSTE